MARVLKPKSRVGGFTLVELTAAVAIATVMTLAATVVLENLELWRDNSVSSSTAYSIKLTLLNNLTSNLSWSNTINNNPNMDCLQKQTDCTDQGGSFAVYDRNSKLVYNPGGANTNGNENGFSANGALCSTFDSVNGSASCPYRYTLTWAPICPQSGACINPQVNVTGTFSFKFPPGDNTRLNASNYKISLTTNAVVPNPPVLGMDIIYTNENQSATFDPLSTSWSDPTNPVTVTSVNAATNGSAVLNGDGTISYTPNNSFFGLDTFSYTATSRTGVNYTGTVWMKVMTPDTWTGNGGDANWSNPDNWCGVVANNACAGGATPAGSSLAVFDATCSANCSATIDSGITVGGILLNTGYLGTVTQGAGNSMTIKGVTYSGLNVGIDVKSGRFIGSNASITVGGYGLQLEGGSFTSTSGTLTIGNGNSSVPSGLVVAANGTFINNSGTLNLNPAWRQTFPISGTFTVNNFTYNGGGEPQIDPSTDFKIMGTATFQGNNGLNYGTYEAYGNVVLDGMGVFNSDSGTNAVSSKLIIKGNGDQTISSTGRHPFNTVAVLPAMTIASTGGTVKFVGNVGVVDQFNYQSGTVDFGTSNLLFWPTYAHPGAGIFTPPPTSFYDFTYANGEPLCIQGSRPIVVTHTFTGRTGDGRTGLGCGEVEVTGDIALNNGSPWDYNGGNNANNGSILIDGSNDQNVNLGSGISYLQNVTINKSSGTVTFTTASDGIIVFSDNFTYQSGTVDVTNANIGFGGDQCGSSGTIDARNLQFTNVTLMNQCGVEKINGTLHVKGDLTLNMAGITGDWHIDNGTVDVEGNVILNKANGGSTTIELVGSKDQTVTQAAGEFFPGQTVYINKTGGTVTLSSDLGINGYQAHHNNQNFELTNGILDMAGHSFTVANQLKIKSGGTLNEQNGSLNYNSLVNAGNINP